MGGGPGWPLEDPPRARGRGSPVGWHLAGTGMRWQRPPCPKQSEGTVSPVPARGMKGSPGSFFPASPERGDRQQPGITAPGGAGVFSEHGPWPQRRGSSPTWGQPPFTASRPHSFQAYLGLPAACRLQGSGPLSLQLAWGAAPSPWALTQLTGPSLAHQSKMETPTLIR